MQDTDMMVTSASDDLVASGAKYDGCFNLTIHGQVVLTAVKMGMSY